MIAIIYRFYLKPHQEESYIKCWEKLTDYCRENCGAIGSSLHKGENGLWVVYSRWPDLATRDKAWPGENEPNTKLPEDIRKTINEMQSFKLENKDLEQFDDICLDLIENKL